MNQDISINKKHQLMHKFKRTIMLIIDERSMISSELLGGCEHNLRKTIFGGVLEHHKFGGIPIVLLLGDDYQLPPVVSRSGGKGAFYVFHKENISRYNKNYMLRESQGIQHFLSLTETVMELTHRTRHENDREMIQLLQGCEKGNHPNTAINKLLSLDINNLPEEKQYKIKKNSTFIFSTHDCKYIHNSQELAKCCSEENPLAILYSEDISIHKKMVESHFDTKATPLRTNICVGCRVAIKGQNIEPNWGIYNGYIGIVHEIVYKEGKIQI